MPDKPQNQTPQAAREASKARTVFTSDAEIAPETVDLTPDEEEIVADATSIPDRDQEFDTRQGGQATNAADIPSDWEHSTAGPKEWEMAGSMDVDESEFGRVSDPAYETTGASRVQRALMDRPSALGRPVYAARRNDFRTELSGRSRAELYEMAKALGIPNRSKMTRAQLFAAVREYDNPLR